MNKLILTSILSFFCVSMFAQDKKLKTVSETQNLSKEVVSLFKDDKISKAFDKISMYWPIPSVEIVSFEEKTIKQIGFIQGRFGKTLGSELLKTERISDFSIRETYVIRYEKSAIRLIFTYYKNDKGWIVNAFKWDDSFDEEFVTK